MMKVLDFRSSAGPGYLQAFLYGCFIVFVGIMAARQGLSHYHAELAFRTGSDTDVASALYYQPENPEAHKIRGMVALRNKDYRAAVNSFEQAVALRQNDFLLWLRLGYSQLKSGDVIAAQAAYQQALTLAPNYSQPNLQMGKMLLATGRQEQAFSFLSKAAKYDRELLPGILHQCADHLS